MVKNATGDLSILADNGPAKITLLRWAADDLSRLVRLTGIQRVQDGRRLRLILVNAGTSTNAPSAWTLESRDGVDEAGLLVQSLFIPDYPALLRDFGPLRSDLSLSRSPGRVAADQALCRLLIHGYIVDHRDSGLAGTAYASWVRDRVPGVTPAWLWRGLDGCLDPGARAAASDALCDEWESGRLIPLVTFLRNGGSIAGPGAAPASPELQSAFEVMLMAWLLSLPQPDQRLDCLFARLAQERALDSQMFMPCIPDCASAADLEERWDAWLLSQKRMIYRPGVTGERDVARLREELLLRRGAPGIPSSAELFPERGGFRELLAFRKAPWVPTLAGAKTIRLRTLALGRGETYQAAVGAYCDFLGALGRRARLRKLEALLGAAERSMAALEEEVAPRDAPGGASGAAGPTIAPPAETNSPPPPP